MRSPRFIPRIFPGGWWEGTAHALSILGKSYIYRNYGNYLVGLSRENQLFEYWVEWKMKYIIFHILNWIEWEMYVLRVVFCFCYFFTCQLYCVFSVALNLTGKENLNRNSYFILLYLESNIRLFTKCVHYSHPMEKG